jgi:hypothetical protein
MVSAEGSLGVELYSNRVFCTFRRSKNFHTAIGINSFLFDLTHEKRHFPDELGFELGFVLG